MSLHKLDDMPAAVAYLISLIYIISYRSVFGFNLMSDDVVIYENKRHPGLVLDVFNVSSKMECGVHCSNNQHCYSFNLEKTGSGQCSLLGEILEPGELVDDTQTDFYDILWRCMGSSCYHFQTIKLLANFSEAVEICDAMGAHVLALETEEENDWISGLFHQGNDLVPAQGTGGWMFLWLGLVDDHIWYHSGAEVDYSFWKSGKPVTDEKTCTMRVYSSGEWVDSLCNKVYGIICER